MMTQDHPWRRGLDEIRLVRFCILTNHLCNYIPSSNALGHRIMTTQKTSD